MKKYGGVAAAPPGAFVGPCFHGNLMRTIELTNEAVGTVNDDIANRQPLTPADLASAWVPSLCEHKAGNLRAGDLPGVAAGDGFVSLAPAAAPAGSGSTFATFDHDGRSIAAATVLCNRGGVPWPSSIQFYERVRKPFESGGVRWLGGVSLETLSHGDRDFVWSVRRNRGGTAVSVAWAANRDTDFGCCPTQDFSADLSPGATPKDRVRVEGLTAYDETAAADRLIRAARAGDAAGVRSLAGATDAATLLAIGRRLGRYSCHEHVDFDAGSWPADVVRRWGGLDAFTTRLTGRRACAVWVAGNPDVLVNLDHAGYRTWRVVDVQELGGD